MGTSVQDLPEPVLCAILTLLEARDLARCAGVCRLWRSLSSTDAVANRIWRRFYTSRWKVTDYDNNLPWHSMYGAKLSRIKLWGGKNRPDWLNGHKGSVRCCRLLPSHNLMATGSLDKTVRLWDLSTCMQLSVSKPHGGTVRCLALDQRALATGCSDHLVRVWLAKTTSHDMSGGRDEAACAALFDVAQGPDMTLRGHAGPVSAMCLTESHLWTGSWDYSVRAWARHPDPWQPWECTSVLTFDDWVGALAVRGPHLLVAAGPVVCVMDSQTGQIVRRFQDLHEGHVSCLEGSQNGRLLFTGSDDGLVLVHDLRMREGSHVLWHHSAGVQSMAFEDPWLATASADGTVALINTEGCMRASSSTSSWNSLSAASSRRASCSSLAAVAAATSSVTQQQTKTRQFQTSGPAYCVDLADQWLVAGSESNVVRVWDFTRAAEAAERAAAAKAARWAASGKGATGRRRKQRNRPQQPANMPDFSPGTSPPTDSGHVCKAGRRGEEQQSVPHGSSAAAGSSSTRPLSALAASFPYAAEGGRAASSAAAAGSSAGGAAGVPAGVTCGVGGTDWVPGRRVGKGQDRASGEYTWHESQSRQGGQGSGWLAPRQRHVPQRAAPPPPVRGPPPVNSSGSQQGGRSAGMVVLGGSTEGFTYRQLNRGKGGKRYP